MQSCQQAPARSIALQGRVVTGGSSSGLIGRGRDQQCSTEVRWTVFEISAWTEHIRIFKLTPCSLSPTFKLVVVRSTSLSFVSGPMPKATKVPIFFPIVAQNTTRDWKSFDALTWKTERSWRQILIQFAFCYNLLIYTFLWMGFDSLLLKIVTKFMVEQISYFVTKHGDLLPKRATYNFLQTKSWLLLLVSWPQLFITFSSHFSITSYFAGARAWV